MKHPFTTPSKPTPGTPGPRPPEQLPRGQPGQTMAHCDPRALLWGGAVPGTQTGSCRQPGSPTPTCASARPHSSHKLLSHRNSSVPRQAGFPEEPAFKQARLTKMGPQRNTPDQNNWLAHGCRHPLCWGTGWNGKRPSAVTPSDGGHTPWDPGIRGQRGPPQDLARNGHERSLCAPRLSRTEIPHCRSWVTKSNSSGKAEDLS